MYKIVEIYYTDKAKVKVPEGEKKTKEEKKKEDQEPQWPKNL